MKASFLLSDINTTNPSMTELMLRNALHEIDHLELIEEDLLRRISTMERVLKIIGRQTECRCSSTGNIRFLNFGYLCEDDIMGFNEIMDLLGVEEPQEEDEEEEEKEEE